MRFKTLEEIQKLTMKQLERSLEENKKAVSMLHELIDSHQRILKVIEPMTEHPCRQVQSETNSMCVEDYKEAMVPFFEEIEKISKEIVKRKMKSISSPFELLGFSSYSPGFFYDFIQIYGEYIIPFFQLAYSLLFILYIFQRVYTIIIKVKNWKTLN